MPTILLAIAGFTTLSAAATPLPATVVDDDTTAIVTVLVAEMLEGADEAPQSDYMVVAADTLVVCPPDRGEEDEDVPDMLEGIGDPRVLPEVPESLRRELLCTQEGGFLPSANIERALVVTESQIEAAFSGDAWWNGFYASFPHSGGYVQVTAPAFSPDRAHAVIYLSHSCGGLCGSGWLFFLVNRGGRWTVANRRMLWIS